MATNLIKSNVQEVFEKIDELIVAAKNNLSKAYESYWLFVEGKESDLFKEDFSNNVGEFISNVVNIQFYLMLEELKTLKCADEKSNLEMITGDRDVVAILIGEMFYLLNAISMDFAKIFKENSNVDGTTLIICIVKLINENDEWPNCDNVDMSVCKNEIKRQFIIKFCRILEDVLLKEITIKIEDSKVIIEKGDDKNPSIRFFFGDPKVPEDRIIIPRIF